MSYWAAARVEPRREGLALYCLKLAGYETYLPRLRQVSRRHGRKVEVHPPLFPGYCFVCVELQWHAARWSPGVLGLILAGDHPARVPDSVIIELRSRERGGLVELPKPPGLRVGDQVRVVRGAFAGQLAIYAGMRPQQRVEILLALLGGQVRAELSRDDVTEVVP
jgi:transcriptional antiterminator RfaH